MTDREPTPTSGHVEMPSGTHLWWAPNAAGGRTYEIGGGVNVWDTADPLRFRE